MHMAIHTSSSHVASPNIGGSSRSVVSGFSSLLSASRTLSRYNLVTSSEHRRVALSIPYSRRASLALQQCKRSAHQVTGRSVQVLPKCHLRLPLNQPWFYSSMQHRLTFRHSILLAQAVPSPALWANTTFQGTLRLPAARP